MRRYIQLDAPHYPLLVDPAYREFYESRGWPAERWIEMGVELDNLVIGDHPGVDVLDAPLQGQPDEPLAGRRRLRLARRAGSSRACTSQRLLLEYDDERSGGFEPLGEVPDDKIVVLGLVTTKNGRVETAEELEARIREAARFVPLGRLALSPQCGFATSIVGNDLTVDEEKAKLRVIAETARRVWGRPVYGSTFTPCQKAT